MKTMKKIMMALFVMACVGMTVSCSKDDKDDNDYNTLLVGTWQIDRISLNGMTLSGEQLNAMMGTIQFTFNANGTGIASHNGETENNDFQWVINGNTITVTPHNDQAVTFTINSLTSTECTFSGKDINIMGQEMEDTVEIHMVKVTGK